MNILDRLLKTKKYIKSSYYQVKGILFRDNDYKVIAQLERAPGYQDIPPSPNDNNTLAIYLQQRKKDMKRPNNDRYELMPIPFQKTLLDLGANLGYFGFAWAHYLKKYIGVDNDPLCIKASESLKKLRQLNHLAFIEADVMDFTSKMTGQYDVCLFFSLYHHIISRFGKEKAHELVNKISKHCNVMYFDMGQKNEQKDYPKRKWYASLPDEDPETFIVEEITTNSEFTKYEILGETNVGKSRRLLFRFEK